MASRDTVFIHADESCLGNQFEGRANPGGAGGLVEVWKDERWHRRDYWTSAGDTTNNQMALESAIAALRLLRRPCEIEFTSDSQYLVKGITEWIHDWKSRGWKRKKGSIENLPRWKQLDRLVARHEMTWRWVRGHTGHPKNEYANFLAIRAAKRQNRSPGLVDSGFVDWLNEQRDQREKYLDYFEFLPPGEQPEGSERD